MGGGAGAGVVHVLVGAVHFWPAVQVAVPQLQGTGLKAEPSMLTQAALVEETPAVQSPKWAAVTVATPVADVIQAHGVAPFKTVPSLLEHAAIGPLRGAKQYSP